MSVPNDSVVFSNSNNDDRVVSIVLSIDRSGSMNTVVGGDFSVAITRLEKVQMAAVVFITNMKCQERFTDDIADNLGVISFSSTPTICVPEDGSTGLLELLTLQNVDDAQQKILALRPGGATAIGSACRKGSELLEKYSIPKAQILLSDGLSTDRDFRVENLNPDIPIYTIGYTFNPNNQNPQDEDLLQAIADHTGGTYYPYVHADELSDIYNDIASQVDMFKVVFSESKRLQSSFETFSRDVPAGQRPGEKFLFRIVLIWQDSEIKFVNRREFVWTNEITVYLRQRNLMVPLEVVQDFDDLGLPNSAVVLEGELTETGDPHELRRLTVVLGGHNSRFVDVNVALLVYDRSMSLEAGVESAKITQGDNIKYQLRVLDDGEPVEGVNYNILMSLGDPDDITTPYRQQEVNLVDAQEGKDHVFRGSIKTDNEGTYKFKVEAQGYSEKSGRKFNLTRLMNVRVTI